MITIEEVNNITYLHLKSISNEELDKLFKTLDDKKNSYTKMCSEKRDVVHKQSIVKYVMSQRKIVNHI